MTPAYPFADFGLNHARTGLCGRCRAWAIMVNESLTAGRRAMQADRAAAQARRALFRGFRGRQDLRAPLHAHRHPDGQHAVLQHDAQSAAAAYRPRVLREGDRMGPAADELAVHAGPDDRHPGVRHDGRHHHRQSRHDRREISQSAVRERHHPLRDEGGRASASRNRGRTPASSNSTTRPSSRTASWSPSATARPSSSSGRRRNAFTSVRARRWRQEARQGDGSGADARHHRSRGFHHRREEGRGAQERVRFPEGCEQGRDRGRACWCASTASRPA